MSKVTLYAIATVLTLELRNYHKSLATISKLTTDPLIKTEINRLSSTMRELSAGAKEELDKVRMELKKGPVTKSYETKNNNYI